MSLKDIGTQRCPECGRPHVVYVTRLNRTSREVRLRAHKLSGGQWCKGWRAADQSAAEVVA